MLSFGAWWSRMVSRLTKVDESGEFKKKAKVKNQNAK